MGPIEDQQDMEQGGCASSDLYKTYGKEQLKLVQDSGLDTIFGPMSPGPHMYHIIVDLVVNYL